MCAVFGGRHDRDLPVGTSAAISHMFFFFYTEQLKDDLLMFRVKVVVFQEGTWQLCGKMPRKLVESSISILLFNMLSK